VTIVTAPAASAAWAPAHENCALGWRRSGENLIEEMPSGAIFHFKDPGVRVEA
jgi:hypothetical protein